MNDQILPGQKPGLLLLDDGRTGHQRQAGALASYLPLPTISAPFHLRQPWRSLAPRRFPGGPMAHAGWFENFSQRPPAAVISCGRRSALVSRWLKQRWGQRCATIHILEPGIAPMHFDRVICPRHDGLRGPNVIETLGSLNPVDEHWLALGALGAPELSAYPGPRVAVLLGGPVAGFRFDQGWVRGALHDLASEVEQAGGSLLAVCSPRTPGWAAGLASDLPASLNHLVLEWPAAAARYAAVLAAATHIAVTGDSVNLISEACATGRPVQVLGSELVSGKRLRFLSALAEAGHIANGDWLSEVCSPPLREAVGVADQLMQSGILG